MSYSWKPTDVLDIMGISSHGRTEIAIPCPSCGGKRFLYNTQKGIGKCFNCEFSADSAKYYAITNNLTLRAAREEIENRLGIKPQTSSSQTSEPKERIVYNTCHTNEEVEMASPEILDATYSAFLSMLTLTDENRNMLKLRGLPDEEINALGYKTLPRLNEMDFAKICRCLINDGYTLKGVPGFYLYENKDRGQSFTTFVQMTKGIIMPLRNYKNQIIGLQIRKDDDKRIFIEEQGEYEAKCGWFSSKNRKNGCGATADVHFACDWKYNTQTKEYEPVHLNGFILTEGIMKADIIHYFQPNCPVMAVAGVSARTKLAEALVKVKEMGIDTILLCYDMDYQTNKHVKDAMDKTKELIEELGLKLKEGNWETKVEVNGEIKDVLKGLDDYLAYTKAGIVPTVKKK